MEQKKVLLSRPLDLLLLLLLLSSAAFCVFRGFVSINNIIWHLKKINEKNSGQRPSLPQVVLDCPLDICFTYMYQYEPYLKDPVGFPRVMVSLEKHMQPPPSQWVVGLSLRTCWSPQMLMYFFYAIPLLIVFIYGLTTPGCGWMLDWTIFFAGAMAQVNV